MLFSKHLTLCFPLAVVDTDANLVILSYQPRDLGSLAGRRLMHVGDIHVGAAVNRMFRMRMNVKTVASVDDIRHVNIFTTVAGCMLRVLCVCTVCE